jgi:two-component system, cell cycle sensor histidine kinase and response regulator CckA
MDAETVQYIFEPFFTTKGPGEGTGLGLATVYGIVKQHDGYITCESKPGSGTTFSIYFPAIGAGEEPKETVARALPQRGYGTILLVDDEASVRDLGSRIFTKAGYTVVTASNGKEALEIYRQRNDIDIVILDLIMPEMGGKQCMQRLLEINPAIKVIVASGYSAESPGKDAIVAKAQGFLRKPYEMRQVLSAVRAALDDTTGSTEGAHD